MKLDERAERWTNPDPLALKIRTDCHPRTMEVLGLNQSTRRFRLRAALSVALKDSWEVANIHADMQEQMARYTDTDESVRAFLSDYGESLQAAGYFLKKYRDVDAPESDVDAALDGLAAFVEESHQRMVIINNWQKRIRSKFPERFLTTRLCEIYAIFSGERPTFHYSHKYTKNSPPPDVEFASFIMDSRTAFGHPSPNSAVDARLRDVGKGAQSTRDGLEMLTKAWKKPEFRGYDYANFYSTNELVNLINAVTPAVVNSRSESLPAYWNDLI